MTAHVPAPSEPGPVKPRNPLARGIAAWRRGDFRVFQDFAVLSGGQIGSKLLGFLTFALIARVLQPAEYGAVEYIVGLSVFFATVVEGGLGTTGIRRTARDPALLGRLAFQIPIARLIIGAPALPLMAVLAMTSFKGEHATGLTWLFTLSLLTVPWRQEWLLQATERMTEAAIAQMIRAAAFALFIWLLVRGSTDVVSVGWAEIASVVLMTAYCIYVQQAGIVPVRLKGSFEGFGSLMREGAAVGMTNMVWAVNQFAPLFMIGALYGGVQTAWFAAGSRIIGSLLTFSNLYHFNLYPAVTRATEAGKEQLASLLAVSFRVSAWASIGLAIALTLLAEPIVTLAFGHKLTGAAPMFAVLAWTFPVALMSGHARWSLVASGAQVLVLSSQIAGLATIVVTGLALKDLDDGLGFAIASLAGAVGVWIVSHGLAVRRGIPSPPLLLAVKPALVGAAALGLDLALHLGLLPSLAILAVAGAAAPFIDRRLLPDLHRLGAAKAMSKAKASR